MPIKFVTRAAEHAGVSLETAEHRWKEAKAAVHKGKRRGSWYWGKVMNTFKRMMGLMEAVTLKEWMLLEEDTPFVTWPEMFHLYDRYAAVRVVDDEFYVCYNVEVLMGDNTKIQLSAGCSKLAADPNEVSYTLGYDRNFTQKLGIRQDNKFAHFKKWAIDAVQKFIEREGLAEGLHKAPFKRVVMHLPDELYIGKGLYLELYPVHRVEHYTWYIHRLMDDAPVGKLFLFRRGTQLWMAVHRMDDTMVKVIPVDSFSEEDIKKFILAHPPINLNEGRYNSAKDRRVEPEWVPFTVEPISGEWPASRGNLWRALDDAFGEHSWELKDKTAEHSRKWTNNLPVTYVHHADATMDYKKLKAAGFRITFLPD